MNAQEKKKKGWIILFYEKDKIRMELKEELFDLDFGCVYRFVGKGYSAKPEKKLLDTIKEYRESFGDMKLVNVETNDLDLEGCFAMRRVDVNMLEDYGVVVMTRVEDAPEDALDELLRCVLYDDLDETEVVYEYPKDIENEMRFSREDKTEGVIERLEDGSIVIYNSYARIGGLPSQDEWREGLPPQDALQDLKDDVRMAFLKYMNETGHAPSVEVLRSVIKEVSVPDIPLQWGKPSSLVMNEDLDFVLPEFDELVVKMPLLNKDLYILFLLHPEGIRLKELVDYKEQLLDIYEVLSPNSDTRRVQKAIDELVNPWSGSLVQKLSKIKRTILNVVGPLWAPQYAITGEKGGLYKIKLSREMVKLPKVFELEK